MATGGRGMIKSGFLKAEQMSWDFRVTKARRKTVGLSVPGTTDLSLITLKLRDLKQQQSQEPRGSQTGFLGGLGS